MFRVVEVALDTAGIEAVTLSGSSPSPATHGLFSDLIGLTRRAGSLSSSTPTAPRSTRSGSSWPDAIQLNRREAAAHLRTTTGDADR